MLYYNYNNMFSYYDNIMKIFIDVTEVVFRGNVIKEADCKTKIDPMSIVCIKEYEIYSIIQFSNGNMIYIKENAEYIFNKVRDILKVIRK